MYRKSISLFLALLFCCVFKACACAEEAMRMVPLHDEGISIAVPDSYITVTKYDEEMDPRLDYLEMSLSDIKEFMQTAGSCMYIYSPDFLYEINVMVSEAKTTPLADSSEEEVRELMNNVQSNFILLGHIVPKTDLRRDQDRLFVRTWICVIDPAQYYLQYLTFTGSHRIMITFTSYDQEITEVEEGILDRIVMSSDLG